MKVLAMIVFQCAILYCVGLGVKCRETDDRAASSARMAEQRLVSARDEFQSALDGDREVEEAKRRLTAALTADLDAQTRLACRLQRDWPVLAVVGWRME